MALNTRQSDADFARAQELIPGGVDSPVRAYRAVGRNPLFIDHAEGSKITDVDGNTFIDYVCSWGPNILGAAKPEVIEAVKAVCEKGLTFGAPTPLETELAELICDAVEACDTVRMVNSGTEAVMSAIRLARGYTGRNKIVKFRGNYHGHSDGLLVKAGSGLLTESTPDSAGVPEGYAKYTLLADYNDPESVQKLFDENKGEIAALIVEPVAANMGVVPPAEGFLEYLRKVTEENGTVLIFDEVITGFRIAYGGAGEYFKVIPDMVTMGKIVGGGMPLAAYGGRREIMDCVAPTGPVYQAGTLAGNPVAVTAGIVTLKILRDHPEIYTKIDASAAQIEKAFADKGWTVNRVGSLLSAFMTEGRPVRNYDDALTADTEKFASYFNQMLAQGIYVAPSQFEAMFVSEAHSQEDLDKTIEAIQNVEL